MITETHVQAIHLLPERVEEYLRHHAEPWPEVVAALREAGLHDYTIHYQPEAGLLVQRFSITAEDPAASLARLSAQPEMQPWLRLMTGCQRPVPGHHSWAPMREVFRLD
ncbi:MAG TPA: L-rhamnose mutarotase [Rubellimicrobium sp.]|nr:L-rhamnose mutarotase [Rubellimicrobium sp.]